jgi:4-hydroxythreonine-4-phosphate dehydrogenase
MTGPVLALTMGEPAGIGAEIALKAWAALRQNGPAFALLDNPARVEAVAATLRLDAKIVPIARIEDAPAAFADALPVLPLRQAVVAELGRPSPSTGGAVVESIETAVGLVRSGRAGAVVTNPIDKSVLQEAGFPYPGHTEFLAHLAGIKRAVMMLASPELRVVPITVHIPLRDAPDALTLDLVLDTARVTRAALRSQFGILEPRLALAGLNPHAGENGRMGLEEKRVLEPAVRALRAEGVTITGPHPADTLFHPAARARYDVALCPTHDQALIPLKTLAFDEGVNVTLGLPFVRTSPDHGVALDIAALGVARPDSLIAALTLAARLAPAS